MAKQIGWKRLTDGVNWLSLDSQYTLRAYSEARQADPTLSSLTVPLDRGLELSVVLR